MVKAFVVLFALVLVSPLLMPPPFNLQVVDEATGRGLTNVRITSDTGIVCYTYGNGLTLWSEYSLMGRSVKLALHDEQHRFEPASLTIDVRASGQAVIKIHLRTPSDHPERALGTVI